MSRDIKFRAWDIKNKRTLQIEKIALDDELCCGYVLGTKEYVIAKKEDIELREYTGLKDKNNNEIYEGDIIESVESEEYFVVEFEKETARFILSGESFVWDFDNTFGYECESIGNIYENPELVEKKDE